MKTKQVSTVRTSQKPETGSSEPLPEDLCRLLLPAAEAVDSSIGGRILRAARIAASLHMVSSAAAARAGGLLADDTDRGAKARSA